MAHFEITFVFFFSDSAIFFGCFFLFVFLFSVYFLQMNGPGSLFASEEFPAGSSHPRNDFGNFLEVQ